jgi:hypothetical protein
MPRTESLPPPREARRAEEARPSAPGLGGRAPSAAALCVLLDSGACAPRWRVALCLEGPQAPRPAESDEARLPGTCQGAVPLPGQGRACTRSGPATLALSMPQNWVHVYARCFDARHHESGAHLLREEDPGVRRRRCSGAYRVAFGAWPLGAPGAAGDGRRDAAGNICGAGAGAGSARSAGQKCQVGRVLEEREGPPYDGDLRGDRLGGVHLNSFRVLLL